MTRRSFYDLIDEVPDYVPSATTAEQATQNLRHTLAVFDHEQGGGPIKPEQFVVVATNGYAMHRTGLTWGDLQLINEALARLEGLDK